MNSHFEIHRSCIFERFHGKMLGNAKSVSCGDKTYLRQGYVRVEE